jgi:tetratricopeptide (TPR) repeat protein
MVLGEFMKNYYETLGIEQTASAPEIKHAYFGLVRQYPPERFPKEFKALRAAYDLLSDTKKRDEYDRFLALPEEAAQLFYQAQKAEQQERYDDAVGIYEMLLKKHPMLNHVQVKYAQALEAEGKNGKASDVWHELCKREPGNAQYFLGLAGVYANRGWRKKAIAEYWKAVKIDKSSVDGWMSLINCHVEAKEFKEAQAVCLEALESVEASGEQSVFLLANAYMFSVKDDIAAAEGYLRNMVLAMRGRASDSEKDLESLIFFLLGSVLAFEAIRLFPYIQEMADMLPNLEDTLLERLSEIKQYYEIEILEEQGYSEVFHDLFLLLKEDCDCEDCRVEQAALECQILLEKSAYHTQLLRLKKEYPHLYDLHADFFNKVLRTRDPEKMMHQRLKILAKSEQFKSEFRSNEEDEIFFPQPLRYEEPRVGRNDLCPCGSGKKYKKCCGASDK